MNERTIAVVGSGYWGKNIVRNFAELGALHTVCDSNSIALNQFASLEGVIGQHLERPVDLLASRDVEHLARHEHRRR